ncbi:MAG: hypothetical protein EOM67_02325 [Spirochaetia bacterium]|nr:hypothetical protein [Spirochaetia bacterium]
MAYCVACGVKLEEGASVCPLCHREVVAPKEIIGSPTESLFIDRKKDPEEYPSLKYDKTRKGLIELSITFVGVAIVALLITGLALKDSFSPWFSIACTLLGSFYLFILLFGGTNYPRVATLFTINTLLILFTIDIFDLTLSWSLYAMIGVVLYYIIAVFPFYAGIKNVVLKISVISVVVLFLLFLLDVAIGTSPSWFFPVALPTFLIALFCFVILYFRYIYGKPSLSDLVLSIILNASIGTVAGNFFFLRMIQSSDVLTWSKSVLIISIILGLFLVANATIRKVRFYFNNKIH